MLMHPLNCKLVQVADKFKSVTTESLVGCRLCLKGEGAIFVLERIGIEYVHIHHGFPSGQGH
mgnify:FL=1|jgi:hypothetical protein